MMVAMATEPGKAHLQRVFVRHFKSIKEATVELDRLTLLVGPNGAGKSNFLDSLVFVADCVSESVHHAFTRRGGIAAVRRHSAGHPTNVGMRLLITLADGRTADYSFDIGARQGEAFEVVREKCSIAGAPGESFEYEVHRGELTSTLEGIRPQIASDRLALPTIAALPEVAALYDFLASLRVYSISPSEIRKVRDADEGANQPYLLPDGRNAASILQRLTREHPDTYERICGVLRSAVPGLHSVARASVGRFEYVEFRKDVGTKNPWKFEGLNASDGTLRLLGLLLAVYQPDAIPFLGIEEPETSVHPALAERILEVLLDASRTRQVIVTTHSPDLLDAKDLPTDAVRYVDSVKNTTVIAPLADRPSRVIRERLFTVGEMLRNGELSGDNAAAEELADQSRLF
jgi:predicted ATPase